MKNHRGFSLVELMVVVAIIGILAGIGIPQYRNFRVKAMQSEAKGHLSTLFVAEKAYNTEYQGYNPSLKVIGFGPMGKTRYNIGFQLATWVDPAAPLDPNLVFSTKQICGGFGSGSITACNMVIDTPQLGPDAVVDQTSFSAAAVTLDEYMLMAQMDAPVAPPSMVARLLRPIEALADVVNDPENAMVEVWTMNENKRLGSQKVIYGCVLAGGCAIHATE